MAEDISYGIKNLRTEKELIKSEKRFKELVDLLPEFVFETDLEGNLTFTNQITLKKIGYTRNDLNKGINSEYRVSKAEMVEMLKLFLSNLCFCWYRY